MADELDKRAEAYMRSVMNNDGDVFTRADLYEYIIEAWKAGFNEGQTSGGKLPLQRTMVMGEADIRRDMNKIGELLGRDMAHKVFDVIWGDVMSIPEAHFKALERNAQIIRGHLLGLDQPLKLSKDDNI